MSALKLPPVYSEQYASEFLNSLEPDNTVLLRGRSIKHYLPAELKKFPDFEVAKADLPSCMKLFQDIHSTGRDKHCLNIIAAGGGTVLDVAKFCFRTNLMELSDKGSRAVTLSSVIKDLSPAKSDLNNLIALPTIFGSGSESSSISVIMDKEQKYPFKLSSFLPDRVIYFSTFESRIPERLMVSGLFDAMCHAFEGAMSPLSSESIMKTAVPVIKAVHGLLSSMGTDRHTDKNSGAFWISVHAGAIQSAASAGLVHSIAHAMEFYNRDLRHAQLIASFFVPVMRFNLEKNDRFSRILELASLGQEEFLRTMESIVRRFVFVMPEYEVTEELVMRIMKDPCTRTNCRAVKKSELHSLLHELKDGTLYSQ